MRWNQYLFAPVSIKPLVLFRILFGSVLFFDCLLHVYKGWVYTMYIAPGHHFSYVGLEFIKPLPGNGMYYYFAAMAAAALMVALGLFFRFSIIVFTLLFSTAFLMERSFYNNHNYLIILLSLLLCLSPAGRRTSIDVSRNLVKPATYCGKWIYILLVAQIAIVYFYGAMNKLHPDWLSGNFLSIAFARHVEHPVFGVLYQQQWFVLFIAYAGVLFDLLIVPLLLFKPTRKVAAVAYACFHLFNSYTFNIGIFPFLAISMLPLFSGFNRQASTYHRMATKNWVFPVLVLFLGVQLLLPVRHWLIPGDVTYTGEGELFSWRMMLKNSKGSIVYKVVDEKTGKIYYVNPRKEFASYKYNLLCSTPDMIWNYAQHLKAKAKESKMQPSIFVSSNVSVNKSPHFLLTDSTINLCTEKWQYFGHNKWIVRR